MAKSIWLMMSLLMFTAAQAEQRQQQLDAACEAARQEKLAPERAAYIQECIQEWGRTREDCTNFYRDYGNVIYGDDEKVQRYALYYGLPACQAAFEYRQRYRLPD